MGSKNKLKRFHENERFENVIQPTREELICDEFSLKGRWNQDFFRNEQPLVLELGCGKGEYSIHMAQMYPDKNYIGIDIKGARFWRGAKTALEKKLTNVAFVRAEIELLEYLFAPQEVSEIWITFPDPQLKYKRTKHRLTNPQFLEKYEKTLKKTGTLHLKTDSEFLFGYTLGVLQTLGKEILYVHHDIYHNPQSPIEATTVQTFYENQYLKQNKPITYIKWKPM